MNVRHGWLIRPFFWAQRRWLSKTKSQTHYETLDVTKEATFNEIKSAYFKLSMQYHPDKNKSKEAIAKFRDVSEAYEVLGNYVSRKAYDRTIVTKKRHAGYGDHGEWQASTKQAKPVHTDPRMEEYKRQASSYDRYTSSSGSSSHFDFDAWTRAHYGKTFQRDLKNRREARMAQEMRRQTREADADHNIKLMGDDHLIIYGLAIFLLVFVLWARDYTIHSDRNEIATKTPANKSEISQVDNSLKIPRSEAH